MFLEGQTTPNHIWICLLVHRIPSTGLVIPLGLIDLHRIGNEDFKVSVLRIELDLATCEGMVYSIVVRQRVLHQYQRIDCVVRSGLYLEGLSRAKADISLFADDVDVICE